MDEPQSRQILLKRIESLEKTNHFLKKQLLNERSQGSEISSFMNTHVEQLTSDLSDSKRRIDEMTAIQQELTTAKEQLEALNRKTIEREQRFRDFYESSSDWYWEMDSDLRFSYVSSQIGPVTGIDPAYLVGKRREEIGMRNVSAEDLDAHLALLNRHEPFREFIYAAEKGGELIWVSINGKPFFDEHGLFLGYRGTGSDVTKRVELERALITEQRAKDDFLANMSHELRTPLTAIIGHAQLLAEQFEGTDESEAIRAIINSGQSQLALVNDILDMSKIESGKFTIDEGLFDLNQLLDNLEQMLLIKAQDSGVALHFIQQRKEQWLLLGDSQRIGQILTNLLGNALKFTEEGSVTLTTSVSDNQLRFVVEDSGIGMSPETRERLFKPFEQADVSTSRRFGGSGLGLFISYNLASMMEGTIDVISREGVGSTFTLTLPYRPSQERVLEKGEGGGDQSGDTSEVRLQGKVLVVEDTLAIQLLVRRMLERLGVSVTVVQNGIEAVDIASEYPFDLILMDMQMPEMDGIEATRVLKQAGCEVPIIALTANVMQRHRDAFVDAGCDGFLSKPIDREELNSAVQGYLQGDRQAAGRIALQPLSRIAWSDEFSVNHPLLDKQHKMLLKYINILEGMRCKNRSKKDIQKLLSLLPRINELAHAHMRYEEDFLSRNRYPDLEKHAQEHQQLLEQMTRFNMMSSERFSLNDYLKVLVEWWEHHILIEDMAFKEYFQDSRTDY